MVDHRAARTAGALPRLIVLWTQYRLPRPLIGDRGRDDEVLSDGVPAYLEEVFMYYDLAIGDFYEGAGGWIDDE